MKYSCHSQKQGRRLGNVGRINKGTLYGIQVWHKDQDSRKDPHKKSQSSAAYRKKRPEGFRRGLL